MGLENADYISELVVTNPLGSDPKSQGDDHMRKLSRVLVNQFPAFVSSQAVPAPVTLSEGQINDAALQSALATITGAWDFNTRPEVNGVPVVSDEVLDAFGYAQKAAAEMITGSWAFGSGLTLPNDARLFAEQVDTTLRSVFRMSTADVVVVGNASNSQQLDALSQISARIDGDVIARFVSNALGSLLVEDIAGVERKAGFRNAAFHAENSSYTFRQLDEGAVVRRTSSSRNTYTIPSLEAETGIIFANASPNNQDIVMDDGMGTPVVLDGGATFPAPWVLAPYSVLQIYWVNTTVINIWGNGLSSL